jgi:Flp pilus assembly protein TadG
VDQIVGEARWRACMTGRGRLQRPERGAGVIEFSVVLVGLVLPLVYAIVTTAGVQRAMLGTSSAAREAGRVYATASSATEARARADRAVARDPRQSPARRRRPRSVQVDSTCPAPADGCAGGFGRGATVVVTVTYRVPVAGFLQPVLGAELPVRAVHRTRIDRFRGLR